MLYSSCLTHRLFALLIMNRKPAACWTSAVQFQLTNVCLSCSTGDNHRLFVLLHVKKRGPAVVVCCLYDSGSPYTFLNKKTLSLIGYKDSTPANAEVEVHGTMLPVSLSHDRFEDIDVLGQNFLFRVGAQVAIDYAARTFTIAI